MTNETIIKNFRRACNDLAERVNRQLFDGTREWYWVGEAVGGSCDYGDADFLTPDEMTLILDHGMTYDEYAEWVEANIEHQEDCFINLQSWLKGLRHAMCKKEEGGIAND